MNTTTLCIGDSIYIERAQEGAWGANRQFATVLGFENEIDRYENCNGLNASTNPMFVTLDVYDQNPDYDIWDIGINAKVKFIQSTNKEWDEKEN